MQVSSKKLGTEKIGKLLLRLSLPAAIAMMVNGLYNVIDTIFIGQGVGALAIGGLAIAFPIQMLIMGFAQMVGIGASSAISRFLGSNQVEKADRVAGNAYMSIFIISLIFTILGSLFVDQLLTLFGATEKLLPYAKDYIEVIFLGTVFFSFAVTSNNIIRAEGNAKIAMFSMIIGTGLNILLDPFFIFGQLNLIWFTLPGLDMGIQGAATATIISQFASFVYIMSYMYSGKSSIKVELDHLKLKWEIIKEIFSVGFSAFSRSATSTIFAIVVNNSLRIYGGNIAITIFGIVNRIIAFLFMPIIGVVQGMQPIVGYNYGAKKIARVKTGVKLSIIVSTILATLGWIVGEAFPVTIIKVFTQNQTIIKEGATVFRIMIAMVPFIGIQFVGGTLFQSLGKAVPAIILSLLRQFIILTPLILITPRLFNLGLMGVWISFPIADILAVIITFLLIKSEMKKITAEKDTKTKEDYEYEPA
ncbi:putative efflux protein, MATE family [Halobacteroides halobius DSM 5150]|uniref:Multidrug export protein MepA n=1 Tax=Halobacteroides halobius (strain ATCC 35273 / DSM 5150 / MD-1) TaxID=748449 RepID=L0K9D8_HALHC|nr:MATE family efflux transporter [Halobacteroides halobius]AGB41631.1 putative efflux protein, MATE family [Halobacteroides halobius DSM 5150]